MLLNCGVREDLRVPWTARRSNQSILKEISPGISLEGMILKLKLQYFGHLMWSVDSLEKTLMPGGWDGWMASLTRWMSELRELVMDRDAWHAVIHGVAKSRTRLSHWNELNWTELNWTERHTGSWHCIGCGGQNHLQEKWMQKGKMVAWDVFKSSFKNKEKWKVKEKREDESIWM